METEHEQFCIDSHPLMFEFQSSYRLRLTSIARFALLLFIVEGFACIASYAYVHKENGIPYWDFIAYNRMTSQKAVQFAESPISAFRDVLNSFGQDYNEFFTLPLVPLLIFVGDRRDTYIVGTTAIYLVPFVLAASVLATRLVPDFRRGATYVTLGVAMMTPSVWTAAAPWISGHRRGSNYGLGRLGILARHSTDPNPSVRRHRATACSGDALPTPLYLQRRRVSPMHYHPVGVPGFSLPAGA